MALDIGDVRTGVAISDPQEKVASPICVMPTNEVLQNSRNFKALVEDWEPGLLLCGLPLTLAGEEGGQSKHIREMATCISKACAIPVEFTDERMSSREAKKYLHEMGYDEKAMRGKIDMIAASLFLQSWLDGNAEK